MNQKHYRLLHRLFYVKHRSVERYEESVPVPEYLPPDRVLAGSGG